MLIAFDSSFDSSSKGVIGGSDGLDGPSGASGRVPLIKGSRTASLFLMKDPVLMDGTMYLTSLS